MRLHHCLLIVVFLSGCAKAPSAPVAVNDSVASDAPHRIDAKHLPNAYLLNERVISGGQPDGESAFDELQKLSVKTIISVDGARPNVAAAKRHGMRYLHIPHGYDGISEQRILELAKAVRDLPGPIYIHCHHGKHRGPAAAAVACVSVGLLKPANALQVLTTAGTSENYRGLYDSVQTARRLDDRLLDNLMPDFRDAVELPPVAEAMVAIEHTHDHLKAIATAGWKPTLDHPDLDPAHEALLLKEHFTELLRTDEVRQKSDRFLRLLREGQDAAARLESTLRTTAADRVSCADGFFDTITKGCTACHREIRDVPLSEKRP
jgi:protein tyrosine phosphatase (PTP) superfamily phosphohydrolase (DUF442 family)